MVIIAEANVSINRPVNVVFDYVSNMENFGLWFPGVISIESSNDVAHGEVGKKYLETVKVPLKGHKKIGITVVESLRGQRFVTEGKFPPLMPKMEVSFTRKSDDACDVHWRMYSRNNHPLFKVLMLPIAKSIMGKRAQTGVSKLKRLMAS